MVVIFSVFLLLHCISTAQTNTWCDELRKTAPDTKLVDNLLPSFTGKVYWGNLTTLCDSLPTLQNETIFYNWGTIRNCVRYGIDGAMSGGEMDYLTSNHGGPGGMVQGGGFYLTPHPTSSAGFGLCATYVRIKPGPPILPASSNVYESDFVRLLGRQWYTLAKEERSRLGRYIPYINQYDTGSDRWMVVYNHRLLYDMFSGPAIDANDKIGSAAFQGGLQLTSITHWEMTRILYQDFSPSFWNEVSRNQKAQLFNDAIGYLKSFEALLSYIDGPSVLRASQVSPDNPWSVFEPENFDKFKQTREKYITTFIKDQDTKMFDAKGTFQSANLNSTLWAKKMIDEVIPSLINDFGNSGAPKKFRENEVRAGGDEKNSTFLATGYQVEQMQKNPSLTVYAVPTGANPDEFFVHYFYPSQNYNSKLATRMPAGTSTSAWIAELMAQTFKRVHSRLGAQSYSDFGTRANLWATLQYVSIHPYNDLNGRISRFISYISNFGTNYHLTFPFISDLDLVTEPHLYQALVDEASRLYRELLIDMFREMLRQLRMNSKAVGRDYYKLPSFYGLLNCLSVLRIQAKVTSFSNEQLELIRTRNWLYFLDSMAASGGAQPQSWRLKPSSSFNWKNN